MNNQIYNDKLFFNIFRNKLLRDQILHYVRLINLYYEKREVKLDQILFDNNNQWYHTHKEYFRSIRINFTNNLSVDKVISLFINSLPSNIETIEFGRIPQLNSSQFKLLLDSCNGLVRQLTTPRDYHLDVSTIPNSVQHLTSSFSLLSFTNSSISTIYQSKLTILDLRYATMLHQFNVKDLPSTLTTLYFNPGFNSFIPPNSLPKSLKKIVFGLQHHYPIDQLSILPPNLENVQFPGGYSQDVDFKYFPKSIQKFKFLSKTDRKLKNPKRLSNLMVLDIGQSFQSLTITSSSWSQLVKLSIGAENKKILKSLVKLRSLKKLCLVNEAAINLFGTTGSVIKSPSKYIPENLQSLKLISTTELTLRELPKSITKVKVVYNNYFSHPMCLDLPSTVHVLKLMIFQTITPKLLLQRDNQQPQLKRLKFSKDFKDSIQVGSLPLTLESLELGSSFNYVKGNQYLPSHLKYLKLGDQFDFPLYQYPPTLEILQLSKYPTYEIILDQLPKSLKVLIIPGESRLLLNSSSSSSLPPNLTSIYINSLNWSILSNNNLTNKLIDIIKPISSSKINRIYNQLIKNIYNSNNNK